MTAIRWGMNGDSPGPNDYVGDGHADLAVSRPSTGYWHVRAAAPVKFGARGDIPVPGDCNGDGRFEIAVFRPSNGTWYLR